jgi:predicted  nucleic acid-binding Zn-ribbon protein
MEHECEDCKEMWFDNKASGACPKCGSWEVKSFFDEAPDSYDEDEPDWYDDDDDDDR